MSDLFLPVLLGLPVTLLLGGSALLVGALLAFAFAAGLKTRNKVVRESVRLLVDVIRGVPIIVWLFLLYFGVSFGSFRFEAIGAAITGLGIVTAAYLAEVYRAAVLAIPKAQFEASDALGFTSGQRFRLVTLPQAFKVALPGASTFAIALLKDTSIASVIGVTEIAFLTQAATRAEHAGLAYYAIAAIAYFIITLPLGLLSRALYARLITKGTAH